MALRIKKQYKQPDGTIIEIEGTLDEIAQYEKNLNKTQKKEEVVKKKKELLKDEVQRLVKEELAKNPQQVMHFHYRYEWPLVPNYVPVLCPFCGVYGCTKNHIIINTTDSSAQLNVSQDSLSYTGFTGFASSDITLKS